MTGSTGAERQTYGDEPTHDPDHIGIGRAWHISAGPGLSHYHGIGADWLVLDGEGQGKQRPWWWYLVTTVHLRPSENWDPKIYVPNATHEILFVALDPRWSLPPTDHFVNAKLLCPLDFEYQFVARGDDHARDLTEAVVQHICEGYTPFQGNDDYWRGVVNDTAEHFFYGCHPAWN